MKVARPIVLFSIAAALSAQGPGGMVGQDGMGPGRGPDGRRGRMGMGRGRAMGPREQELARLLSDPAVRQQLGVTAEQAGKIRQQESDFRKAEIRNNAELQIKRMDLNDLLAAEKPDRAAISSKLQEVGAAQLAVEKSAIDNRLNMREALTPAQRQKLQQLMAQPRQPGLPGNPPPARGPQGMGRAGRGPGGPPNAQAPRPPNQ